MTISPEAIAYWYFRLNGFMTITNFIVHPEIARDSCTDVDILGVRFPYRSENITRPMIDDESIVEKGNYLHIVFAEVKRSVCNLNGPWVNPAAKNMDKVLSAVGISKHKRNKIVAKSLYKKGYFTCKSYKISLVCVGNRINPDLTTRYPDVPQIDYDKALKFIYMRLNDYSREKAQHSQWDSNGHLLWNYSMSQLNVDSFCTAIKEKAGIRGLTTGWS